MEHNSETFVEALGNIAKIMLGLGFGMYGFLVLISGMLTTIGYVIFGLITVGSILMLVHGLTRFLN